jgi:hypothetical protein
MSRTIRRTGTNGVIGPALEQLSPRTPQLRPGRVALWLLGASVLLLLLCLGYC